MRAASSVWNVDQGIIVQDLGMVGRYEAHASHVRGQGIDLIDSSRGLQTVV
ncbi:unnamed protein product, partial [marine sediment metagenome]